VYLKEQSILKKSAETASKSTHKPSHNTCLNYVRDTQIDQAWQTKNAKFSLLQPARVVRSPQTLHVGTILKDVNHFSIQRSFFCRAKVLIFRIVSRCYN